MWMKMANCEQRYESTRYFELLRNTNFLNVHDATNILKIILKPCYGYITYSEHSGDYRFYKEPLAGMFSRKVGCKYISLWHRNNSRTLLLFKETWTDKEYMFVVIILPARDYEYYCGACMSEVRKFVQSKLAIKEMRPYVLSSKLNS